MAYSKKITKIVKDQENLNLESLKLLGYFL